MGTLYSLVVLLAASLAAPWYLLRSGRRRFPKGYWSERLGRVPDSLPVTEREGSIWIHAVSVGETLTVAGLAAGLIQRYPGTPVYLSNVTPAGRAAGESRIPGLAGRFFLPVDLKSCLRPVFSRLAPRLLIIVETELWPNLLEVARESGTIIVLVNARLSERSLRGYQRFGFFFRRAAREITWVFAQTERDAERFRSLGARSVSVAGNLKFDAKLPRPGEFGRCLRRSLESSKRGPVLVAGSTMPGEEFLILSAWDRVRAAFPQAVLILAPRHPERFEEVAALMADQGRTFSRRSSPDIAISDSNSIMLLDSIGELAGVFELADVAFVGGSLVPTGGHNLLEPAFWAKPVLFGPHMHNFRDVAESFLVASAAIQVQDASALAGRVVELFKDAELRRQIGESAKQLLQAGSGATDRILEKLSVCLDERWPVSVAQTSPAGGPVQ